MFDLDPKKKRIIIFNKTGCCYHIREEYQVIPNRGLKLVRTFEEDARGASEKVVVTDSYLMKGEWKKIVKYYPIDEYYK